MVVEKCGVVLVCMVLSVLVVSVRCLLISLMVCLVVCLCLFELLIALMIL